MQEIALDSNVLIAYFLENDSTHADAVPLMRAFQQGQLLFHISMLVLAEICAVVKKKTQDDALMHVAKTTMDEWVNEGRIKVYPLDRDRFERAYKIATERRLSIYDALISQVADGLKLPLCTFEKQIIDRFPGAKSPQSIYGTPTGGL